jgi:DNA-binding NtrC family response regulator
MSQFNQLKKIRVLLIDDDEWIRDSLCIFFENEGWHLIAVETAEEAIELLKKEAYEVIITDYRLPGMDGLTFLRQIQEIQPHAMKILITAYWSNEVLSEANRLGVHDLIKKPFTTKVIEDTLSRLVKRDELGNKEEGHHLG